MTDTQRESDNNFDYIPDQPASGISVLLVEDDESVSPVAETMLEMLGYTVIKVSNGVEALERYQRNAADIDLVITDIVMPLMDGYKLFRELKRLAPGLPVFISSGLSEIDITARISFDEMAGFIKKPYTLAQLQQALKSVTEELIQRS